MPTPIIIAIKSHHAETHTVHHLLQRVRDRAIVERKFARGKHGLELVGSQLARTGHVRRAVVGVW